MLYKEALSTQHLPRVPLQTWSSLVPSYNKAWQFSSVRPWVGEHFVVTTSDHTLFVLDPNGSVVGVLSLGHPINMFAITRGFVYLLCNDLKKPICRVSVKQSFLKALQKTLPLSPAHSPRISPARKVLPVQDGVLPVSTKLNTPTELVPTPTVTTEERSGEPQATVTVEERFGDQHVCSELTPSVTIRDETERERDSTDHDSEPLELGHKESLNHNEAVIKSKEVSACSKAEETVANLPDSMQTLTTNKIQEEHTGSISERQKGDSTDISSEKPSALDDNSIQQPVTEGSLSLIDHQEELPKETTELADTVAVAPTISEAAVTCANNVTSKSTDVLTSNVAIGNSGSQVEGSLPIQTSVKHSDETHQLVDKVHVTESESVFLSDVVTRTDNTDGVQSSSDTNVKDAVVIEGGEVQSSLDTNVEDTIVTETVKVDHASKLAQESQREPSGKTDPGPEQPTLHEALSTMKAEVRELFKPKFDKFTNMFKVASPGSLSPGRLRVIASRNIKDGKERVEDGKEEKKCSDLEVQIDDDNTREVPNQKQEKTEQDQSRKPDLKEILKLNRISNLLNKENSGSSTVTPSSATPTSDTTTPIVVTPAPLDPTEQQRRFRMSLAKGEDEDDVVVKTKSHHRKKKRRRHKKLSSATSE